MSRLRVWFNALHSKAGGGLTYLDAMVPRLAADPRIELTVVAAPGQAMPCPVAVVSPPAWVVRLGFVAVEQIWLPIAGLAAAADVIYSPCNYGPLWGPRAVILLSNSTLVGKLETRWRKRAYWLGLDLATRACVTRAAAVLAVSASIRDELAHGTRSVTVIPHGVSECFTPGTAPREDFILAVGDIYIQKNFHTLIMTMANVRKKYPGLMLKLAGRVIDGDYRARLGRVIDDLGLADRVVFLGQVDRDTLADLYRRCRLFVFPSMAESFGMPILEAMAAGAPVVASNRSAMPEVVGDAGLLTDAADPAQLFAAMDRLLADPVLAAEVSKAGVARAARFGWAEAAEKTAQAIIAASRHKPAYTIR